MKKKRILSLFLALALLLLSGCGEAYKVKKNFEPGALFSHYDTFASLIGTTGKQEVLDALKIDLQEVNIENRDHLGIPLKENYAGMDFDIYLSFGNSNDQLVGVDYRREYAYPGDREKMVEDIMTVCTRLAANVETQPNTSFVFNWAETYLKEDWDREIKVWEDASVLRRLMNEEYNGSLMWWDMTDVAGESVKEYLKTLGSDAAHTLSVSIYISEYIGVGYIEIHY